MKTAILIFVFIAGNLLFGKTRAQTAQEWTERINIAVEQRNAAENALVIQVAALREQLRIATEKIASCPAPSTKADAPR